MESEVFARRLFNVLCHKRNVDDGSVDLKEFDRISNQSFVAMLQSILDMVDKDADGRITREEVREIISLSASANKLSNIQNQAEEYAALIMEELDPDHRGYIAINSLQTLLRQAPNQSVQGESRKQELKPRRLHRDTKYLLVENWQRAWVMALWIGATCGLFSYKYILVQRQKPVFDVMGHCACFAKGSGEMLKLNMALVLLPVCRNTITWLRDKTRLGDVVPFDDNLNFHKVIAVVILIGVGIHGIAHMACVFPRLLHATQEEYKPMIKYFGNQPESYWHFVKNIEVVTGIVMVMLMVIAFTLATPWLRRSKTKNLPEPLKRLTGFNTFWYSHHLFVIVYALLVVHGIDVFMIKSFRKKTTWMYLAVPVSLYLYERLTRLLRSSIKAVAIQKVVVYPGNVLALHMSKPHGFRYRSGQYVFVKCATVSPLEWHPFSITSAPGDDYLSVHIRTLGDWTRQLKTVFSEVCEQPTDGRSGLLRAEYSQGSSKNLPRILIDGPYGAPAQEYKNYEVVLLVGLGIGATPMVSIVKDIINNIKAKGEEEVMSSLESGDGAAISKTSPSPSPSPGPSSSRTRVGGNFKTRKAYFCWVTREQGSFDWFKGVMNEVAEMELNGVIELHNYCTSIYGEGDARSAMIAMLQSLVHAERGVDVVSGTRVKSRFAKPDWRSVYEQIAVNHSNARVGVFYCGAPALTKELRQLASDFTRRTSTKFVFHKENFYT